MVDFTSMVGGGIAQLLPYRMGKPLELMQAQLKAPHLLRLNAGESPYGVSRKVREVLGRAEELLARYPDSGCYYLKDALKRLCGYELNHITVGADSAELISLLCRALVTPQVNVIIPQLSSLSLERSVQLSGARIITTPIMDDWTPDLQAILDNIDNCTRMVLMANPTNPIGAFSVFSDLKAFMEQVPEDVLVVVDEELVDYIGQGYRDIYELILTSPNLIVLRSFSHAYGLASLRIGYMLSCEEISGIINVLRDPFNVSQLALDCATAALDDVSFFNKVIHANDVERNRFREFCAYYGLTMINTKSCSVTIDFGEQAERYYNAFLQLGIFTRPLSYLGLRSLINISIGHPKATDFLLAKLEKLILSDAQQSRLD